MDQESSALELLKELDSPADIVAAVADLSRKMNGKVIVHLVSSNDPNTELWLHPLPMQDEIDDKRSHGNIYVKFNQEIRHGKLRISGVHPLEVNDKEPLKWMSARERFARDNDLVEQDYAGRMVREKNKQKSS